MKKILLLAFSLFLYAQSGTAQLAGELGILDPTFLNSGNNPFDGTVWEAGDTYRLVFVTRDSSTATSTDITTYNTFVQAEANGSSLNLSPATWNVVGSTETVNVRTNTGTTGTMGESIILIDGMTVIANNYADFWDGHAFPGQDIDLDEDGNFHDTKIFAGTFSNGNTVASIFQWLGTNMPNPNNGNIGVSTGLTKPNTVERWIRAGNESPDDRYSFYALSDPLTVCAQDTYVVDADMDNYIDDADADTIFSCTVPEEVTTMGYRLIGLMDGPEEDCMPGDPNLTTPGNPCTDDDQYTIDEFVNDECECVAGAIIPTLSQWGIIALSMIMLIFGLVAVRRRKTKTVLS
jgi:hypothetical protein